jgi:hypothetical protein
MAFGTGFLRRLETQLAAGSEGTAAADLDSVWHYLDQARDLCDVSNTRAYWRLHRTRASAAELQATLRADALGQSQALATATAELRESMRPLRDTTDDLELALSQADLAAIEAKFSILGQAREGFTLADSLLDLAASALTRARFVAGDPAIGTAFEQIRCEILCQHRDRAKLRAEVLAMRGKMHENLGTKGKSDQFDLKHDFGGLVGVEFIVQYLTRAYACHSPQLTGNLGNIALLRIAAECGLVPADRPEVARDAYREYRRLQHLRRLNNLDSRVEAAPHAERIAAVRALWKHVFKD